MSAADEHHVLAGQVTYRRRLSAKLVFYDILEAKETGLGGSWWEVVVKAGTYGTVQDVKGLRDSLKLGDIIKVVGVVEAGAAHPSLQALRIEVVTPWKQQHPNAPFLPQPAPTRSTPAQPCPQQQQRHGLELQTFHDSHAPVQQEHATACKPAPAAVGPAPSTPAPHAGSHLPYPQAISGAADPGSSSPAEPAAVGTAAPAAARVTAAQVAVCKFWVNSGRCAKGALCPYLHKLPAACGRTGRRGWVEHRERQRQQRATEHGFVHDSSAAAKRQRAQVFAAWLVQQYGKERLNAGTGVLDVAGGSGALTFELAFVHGIKCTLIDPRPLKLSKLQHRAVQESGRGVVIKTITLEQLQQDSLAGPAAAALGTVGADAEQQQQQQQQQQQPPPDMQQHKQLQQQQEQELGSLHEAVHTQQEGGVHLPHGEGHESGCQVGLQHVTGSQAAVACSRTISRHQEDVQQHEDPVAPPALVQLQQLQACFGPELWGTACVQGLLHSRSVVVGLHPDQATEPILTFAVQKQLPFAIVPCCVFSRLFPHRKIHVGGTAVEVVSYEDLVQYLVQQGEGQQGVLSFEGANTVVYR